MNGFYQIKTAFEKVGIKNIPPPNINTNDTIKEMNKTIKEINQTRRRSIQKPKKIERIEENGQVIIYSNKQKRKYEMTHLFEKMRKSEAIISIIQNWNEIVPKLNKMEQWCNYPKRYPTIKLINYFLSSHNIEIRYPQIRQRLDKIIKSLDEHEETKGWLRLERMRKEEQITKGNRQLYCICTAEFKAMTPIQIMNIINRKIKPTKILNPVEPTKNQPTNHPVFPNHPAFQPVMQPALQSGCIIITNNNSIINIDIAGVIKQCPKIKIKISPNGEINIS
jgi:hypothetical protein